MGKINKKFFIGLDQGTTGTTSLLLDDEWNVVSQGYKEHTMIYPQPGWVEQDPWEMLSAALGSFSMALKNANINTRQIASIGLSNQGESCIIWNRKTGKPVYNIIVWRLIRRCAAPAV
jgi:glycerol kinase